MTIVTLDFETRSPVDLTETGVWPYSECPQTDVICLCFAVGDGPVQEWWPGKNNTDDMPPDFAEAVAAGALVEAHNVAFEISIHRNVMVRRYGWPDIPLHQWRDSMATACYFALPPKLDKLAKVLGLAGKDPEGARLISKYSKLHLKTAKTEIPPEDFKKFVAYCRQDVETERQASEIMGDLPEREIPVFLLDLETNLRGLCLDRGGIEMATRVVDKRSDELTEEFRSLTGLNPTQRDKVLAWFKSAGLELENMQADYLENLLEEGEVPAGPCRRALQIRLEINKASTKKLDAMARQCGSDGRARFQTRYHGAVTGRNTGSGFQPLNLNRGFEGMDPAQLVRDIMYGEPAWLDACYGDAMDAVAKASRYWITAAPGKRIISGDFVSIEAVILACLAGEEWKIEAFRNREPIYERTADMVFGLPPGTVSKKTHPTERQDGKRCELAFGYQGSLGAWLKFDPRPVHTDERIIEFCRAWRKANSAIVAFWRNMEQAAIAAVAEPGSVQTVQPANARFEIIDNWLTLQAPNGKRIWYFDPQLRAAMPRWHRPQDETIEDDDGNEIPNPCNAGTCDCKPRPQLTYMAQKEGQWKRVATYGGKLTENITQMVSREVLAVARLRLKAAGYHEILTVYDEIVCEDDEGFGSKEEFERLMKMSPGPWAEGWPISVDVGEGKRYAK